MKAAADQGLVSATGMSTVPPDPTAVLSALLEAAVEMLPDPPGARGAKRLTLGLGEDLAENVGKRGQRAASEPELATLGQREAAHAPSTPAIVESVSRDPPPKLASGNLILRKESRVVDVPLSGEPGPAKQMQLVDKPAVPTEPPKPAVPAEPPKPAVPTEPPRTAVSAEPPKSAAPMEPSKPAVSTEPSEVKPAPETTPALPGRVEELTGRLAANEKRIAEIDNESRIHAQRSREYTEKADRLEKDRGPGFKERAQTAKRQATNEAKLRDKNTVEHSRLKIENDRMSRELYPPPKPTIGPGPAQPHGGAWKDMKAWGGERNHIPPADVTKISPERGPAIWMEKADHLQTNSLGNLTFKPTREYPYSSAIEWRSAQRELIRKKKIREAIQMDIDDIQSKFGDKYNKGIQEMLEYIRKTLSPSEF